MSISVHHAQDIGYGVSFAIGLWLRMLLRSDYALHSKTNALKTRRAFFYLNWVPLLTRSVIEFGIVWWPWRHIDMIPSSLNYAANFYRLFPRAAMVAVLMGLGADFLLDWIGQAASQRIPALAPLFKEIVPPVPE